MNYITKLLIFCTIFFVFCSANAFLSLQIRFAPSLRHKNCSYEGEKALICKSGIGTCGATIESVPFFENLARTQTWHFEKAKWIIDKVGGFNLLLTPVGLEDENETIMWNATIDVYNLESTTAFEKAKYLIANLVISVKYQKNVNRKTWYFEIEDTLSGKGYGINLIDNQTYTCYFGV